MKGRVRSRKYRWGEGEDGKEGGESMRADGGQGGGGGEVLMRSAEN